MISICKPMSDIEADYVAAIDRSLTVQSLLAARAQALAELRGSWGLTEEEGLRILLGWMTHHVVRQGYDVNVFKTAPAAA